MKRNQTIFLTFLAIRSYQMSSKFLTLILKFPLIKLNMRNQRINSILTNFNQYKKFLNQWLFMNSILIKISRRISTINQILNKRRIKVIQQCQNMMSSMKFNSKLDFSIKIYIKLLMLLNTKRIQIYLRVTCK